MQNRMTPEKMLHITKCQGHFDISLKWRYDYLRRIAKKLIDDGKLICIGRVNRAVRYKVSK
jgi:hypothetical protein